MDLKILQTKQAEWQERNFPETKDYHPLLGIAEEVGELCHAHLKAEQGIRGSEEEHRLATKDAIGDIIIFLAGYCNQNGYDIDECLNMAWAEVEKRDWTRNKDIDIESMMDK